MADFDFLNHLVAAQAELDPVILEKALTTYFGEPVPDQDFLQRLAAYLKIDPQMLEEAFTTIDESIDENAQINGEWYSENEEEPREDGFWYVKDGQVVGEWYDGNDEKPKEDGF